MKTLSVIFHFVMSISLFGKVTQGTVDISVNTQQNGVDFSPNLGTTAIIFVRLPFEGNVSLSINDRSFFRLPAV